MCDNNLEVIKKVHSKGWLPSGYYHKTGHLSCIVGGGKQFRHFCTLWTDITNVLVLKLDHQFQAKYMLAHNPNRKMVVLLYQTYWNDNVSNPTPIVILYQQP